MILEKVPAGLRGELSRWMIEPRTGVFVGNISAMVRDKLWEKVCGRAGEGAAALIHSASTEQGFAIRTFGERNREIIDAEGVWLVKVVTDASR